MAIAPSRSVDQAVLGTYLSRTPASRAAHDRARGSLPGGVNRAILHHAPYPVFVSRAGGAYVTDLDGNDYLDAIGNYTSMIFGHADPALVGAVEEQMHNGTAIASPSTVEAELAELLRSRMPSLERVRFMLSGTEATMMAIRAARAYTNRSLVAKFEGGYHGFHDYATVSLTPSQSEAGPAERPRPVAAAGVPSEVRDTMVVLPFNRPDEVEQIVADHADELAAIVVEPVMGVAGVITPAPGFLELLRRLADRHGIVLVFDEVITFRLAFGGAQELFGVRPDLTTLGKVIGGGFPVAALGGRAEIMDVFDPAGGPKVLLSGSWHAGLVPMVAALATVRQLTREVLARLDQSAALLRERLDTVLEPLPSLQLTGIGSLLAVHATAEPITDYRASAHGDKELVRLLHLALLNEGVMIAPRGMACLSVPMTAEDLDDIVGAFERALGKLELLTQ